MYNHKVVEKKWQDYWAKHDTFKTGTDPKKKNYYALDMFPFPSGKGLHVGHPEGYGRRGRTRNNPQSRPGR